MRGRVQDERDVTIHVWGPPEDGMVGFDERVCDEPDQGEEVVFHVEPETFAGGARMCPVCATIFWPEGKAGEHARKPV